MSQQTERDATGEYRDVSPEIVPYEGFDMARQLKFARGFDLLPPLSWQQSLAPEQEVYYFKGHVSEPVGDVSRSGDELTTDLGGTLRQQPSNRLQTVVEYGSPDPFDRSEARFDTTPLGEIADDIYAGVTVPDISTLQLGVMHPPPDGLEDHPTLGGTEFVAHAKVARGNRSAAIQKKTGLDTANPYQLAKEALLSRGVIDESDGAALSKRLKSTLVTRGVLTDTGRTQDDFRTAGILSDLIRTHKDGHFWESCGHPVELTMGVNGERQAGRVYRLEDFGEIVAV